MEVLSDVGDADDEVKHEARALLVGLGYKTPRSAMMADIELDCPEPGAWPGGKVNALIWEVMQHLAGLQAVADSNAAKQARQAVAPSEMESPGHPPSALALSCVPLGR